MSSENKAILRKKIEQQLSQFTEQLMCEGGKVDKLLNSGAIDFSESEVGFVTSSQVMCALGRYMEDQYTPNGSVRNHKRDVKNLESFL